MIATRGRVAIVGAGVFGLTAALELRARGWRVELVDPGPLPHPLAASTDLSKVVRLEYGADEAYTELAERALAGWRRWNARPGPPLFHETGVLFARRTALAPGTFEHDSLELLTRRGHRLERVSPALLRARFPAWAADRYADGIFDPSGGWVESGRVVERLVGEARQAGVRLVAARARLTLDGAAGAVRLDLDGAVLDADVVVVAAGAWTPWLLPELAGALRAHGMPVFHLRPAEPALFEAARFPVFGADLSGSGWYGFPLHPDGVVKIAHHGPGRELHPESPARAVTPEETARLRAFLRDTFPALADAPLAHTRVCLYCDSWDGHLWIAADPARPGLVVAAGDSGHAFKLAPVLGALIADAVEGRAHPLAHRFRWRPELRQARSDEAARHQPDP